MSLAKKPDTKSCLDKCFSENEYDASAVPSVWKKESIAINKLAESGDTKPNSLELDIPKTDLFSVLPPDILTKMVSVEVGP
jgi:hypothetical protein